MQEATGIWWISWQVTAVLSRRSKAPGKVDKREEVTQRPGGGASMELGRGMCSAFRQGQMGAKGFWTCIQTFFCTALSDSVPANEVFWRAVKDHYKAVFANSILVFK